MLQTQIVSVVCLVWILGSHQSDASPFESFMRARKLSRFLSDITPQEVSPAPSPGTNSSQKKDTTGNEKCLLSSQSCTVRSLTACLEYSGNALKDAFLILENTGEGPIEVNYTITPDNIASSEIQLPEGVEKVNVTAKVQANSVISLNASVGNCIILLKSSASGWPLPYGSTLTPLHGAYLLFSALLTVGGAWACCKFRSSKRPVDGIPYQELEMGQADLNSANNDVEIAEGWDESWDDDWDDGDEIREVKSPSRPNGHASRSSSRDGWEDNWDD